MSEPTAVRSLWAATARPLDAFPTLSEDIQADIAIVGGGYTGLSAAHHLAADGHAPVVLEAASVGWGASGRNGGYVSVKSRAPLAQIFQRHGREVARRLHGIGHEAVDCVEEMIEVCRIADSGFRRSGHLTGALDERAHARMEAVSAFAARELGDSSTRVLSRREAREAMGSEAFQGASLNSADGGVHPLNLLRGLARHLQSRAIPVYERSPVLRVVDDGAGVRVETSRGLVRAGAIVFATNAYSGLTPAPGDLAQRIIPFRSAAIATAPLSPTWPAASFLWAMSARTAGVCCAGSAWWTGGWFSAAAARKAATVNLAPRTIASGARWWRCFQPSPTFPLSSAGRALLG